MSGHHPWPDGYVSGWCSSQLVADHARCPLQHTTDRTAPGCHCAPCALPVTLITPEPAAGDPVEAFLSDPTMDAAVAPPAEQPGATAATKIMPGVRTLQLTAEVYEQVSAAADRVRPDLGESRVRAGRDHDVLEACRWLSQIIAEVA